MFCKNCGSKIPDNSMFCQVCGARLGEQEQAQKSEERFGSFDSFGYEQRPQRDYRREPETRGYSETSEKVSFDWSNVKDETHKREIRDIASPWDSPVYSDDTDFNPAPSKDHSRTLSFIEILKQEREEKLQESDRRASELTRRPETSSDFSPFDDAPRYGQSRYDEVRYEEPKYEASRYEDSRREASRYDAPRYEDSRREASRYDAPRYEDSRRETSRYDAPRYEDSRREASRYDEPRYDEPKYEAPRYEGARYAAPKQEEPAYEDPGYEKYLDFDTPAYKEPKAKQVASSLSWLDETEEKAPVQQPVHVAVETEPIEMEAAPAAKSFSLEDDLSANDPASLSAELDAILGGDTSEPKATESNEEVLTLDDIVSDSPFEPESVLEKRATLSPSEAELEVEALKKRIAELTGTYDDVPGYKEQVVEAAPAQQAPISSTSEPGEVLSIEDLEKDLFGDFADDVEADATKKIDKFYTLYKKNEEFQKLLDEEYNKLKTDGVDGVSGQPVASAPVEMPRVEASRPAPTPAPTPVIEPEPRQDGFRDLEMSPAAKPAPQVEEQPLSKKEAKAAAKAERAAAKAAARTAKNDVIDDEEEEQGGGALTVIAVVIAVLLVVLLGIILVLNFAPDSGIAMKIDAVIENIASYFTVVDDYKTLL